MRRAWRISVWPGLSGAGGLLQSARWHSKGHRVLYLGEHPALALIEVMANMRLNPAAIPLTLKLIAIDIKNGALKTRAQRSLRLAGKRTRLPGTG